MAMDFNDSEVVDLLGRLSNAKSPSGFEDETIDVVPLTSPGMWKFPLMWFW